MAKVIVYTKWCLDCMWPEETRYFNMWAADKTVKVKRTTYRPDYHLVATKLYGNEDYNAFVVYKGEVEDFVEFANKCKNKLIKKGKLKNDMQDLQRAEDGNREGSETSEDYQDPAENGI